MAARRKTERRTRTREVEQPQAEVKELWSAVREIRRTVHSLNRTVNILVVCIAILVLEVWDVMDVDISAGENFSGFAMSKAVEYGQTVVALVVMATAVLSAFRGFRKELKDDD